MQNTLLESLHPATASKHPVRQRPGRLMLALVAAGLTLMNMPQALAVTDVSEMSLEQLLDVAIVGASKYEQRQSQVAAAVSVITRSEIRAFDWRSLSDALGSLPGLFAIYDRQYSYLSMRGFGLPGDYNTRVLLTINGNRVNDVVYDSALIGNTFPLDMDLIERIEFIPGPGGAVYGQNALFGVINIVTRKASDVAGVEMSAAYLDPQHGRQGRFAWGQTLENGLDLLFSASVYTAAGEDLFFDYGDAGTSGVATGMDGELSRKFFAHAGRGPWSIDLVYGDRRKDDPTASFLSDPLVPGQYQRDKSLLAQVQYEDDYAGNTLRLTGRVYFGQERYSSLLSYGTPYIYTGSSDWKGVELRALYTGWQDHRVMVGLEYQDNARVDQGSEDIVTPDNNFVIPLSGWRRGIYVQDEWQLGETLSATIGLRHDANNVTGIALSPRAALIWQATPATTLKVLYGQAHRAPNAYERDYDDGVTQVGNPGLAGETIDTYELVADHRIGQDLTVRGTVYHWQMEGLVTLGTEPISELPQYQSGEDVKANGLELSADKTWQWGGRLRGSLSYQDVAYVSGSGLSNSPQLLGKLNFSGPLLTTGLRLGYELRYLSERDAIDGSRIKPYWLSNLTFSTDRWVPGLEVSLGVYNLFNQRYVDPGSDTNWQTWLEQDGRSFRLKATYHF